MKLLKKIVKELPLICFIVLFLSASSILNTAEDGFIFNFKALPMAILRSIIFALIFALLSFNRFFSYLFFIINLTLFDVCLFLCIQLQTHISPLVVSLLLQTDQNETKEFFMSFFPFNLVLLLCGLTIISIILFTLTERYWNKRYRDITSNLSNLRPDKYRYILLIVIGLVICSITLNILPKLNGRLFNEQNQPRIVKLLLSPEINQGIPYMDLYNSVRMIGNNGDRIDKIYAANNIAEIDSCTYISPNIVVVIGESFIKRHSNIYGYYLNTNPHLTEELDKGNLFAFTDVIAYAPSTASFLKYFYSTIGANDTLIWEENPLFPVLFKKVGYKVSLFDNQSTRANSPSVLDDYNTSFFLNPVKIHNQCFDYRNSKLQSYDGDFIDQEKEQLKINGNSPTLNIIHLYGQHIKAAKRYPHTCEYDYFNGDSIKRTDIKHDLDKLTTIAEYDNATRYNDHVIKKIIDLYESEDVVLIYVPDHGDCEYDDHALTMGRMINSLSNELIKLYLEVPMFIWCSDKFKESRPEIIERISMSVDKPFMTDDLSHILFDLAGIYSQYYKPERSLINTDYMPQQRIATICEKPFNYDENKSLLETVVFP